MKRSIIIALFFFSSLAHGQVTVNFMPELYGRNLNGLFNIQTVSPAGAGISVILEITVTERAGGTVCAIRSPEFTVMPGNNPLSAFVARNSSISFSSGKLGQLTSANRAFPEGDYEYCYSITIKGSDNPPTEQCFSYTLAPFSDLSLIDPYDKDTVCNKRPIFTWQPLVPGILGSYYQLVLAEIKSGQSATEALNYNLPVINQRGIIAPLLPYPSIAKELQINKRYAWQVTAYKDQTILNRSDIWEFIQKCPDTVVTKDTLRYGYRDIDDLTQGAYHQAIGFLRFKVVNSYTAQLLKYTIKALKNPDKPIKGLPKLNLNTGENLVSINLVDNGRFKAGDYYVLEIILPNGTAKKLQFLYETSIR
jgi:hypothetical protein